MPVTINGNGSITGLSVGGLPNGIVDTDVLADNAVTSAKSSLTEGITMIDQWRLNDNYTFSNNSTTDLTANWERNDASYYGGVGSPMTESSGVFNFPITGKYLIMGYAQFYASGGSHSSFGLFLNTKVGSGGSFVITAQGWSSGYTTNAYGCINMSILFDVEDVSGDNVKLAALAGASSRKLLGSSTVQRTGFTFIRVGNT